MSAPFFSESFMEKQINNKKRSIGVSIFGIIFIILGILLFVDLYISFKNIPLEVIKYFPYFHLLMSPFLILYSSLYIICGIGILRLRFWARYIIIVLLVSSFMSPLNQALIFGGQSLNIRAILAHFVIVFFILWFFTRAKIKKQFEAEGVRFNLKTRYGAVICVIIFLTILSPVLILAPKIYFSLRYKYPFFIEKPQAIKLQDVRDSTLLKKFRRTELFNTSFLIPRNYIISALNEPKGKFWYIFIVNSSEPKKGSIILNSPAILETAGQAFKKWEIKNSYDFEKTIYTNNWSPIFVTLRHITHSRPGPYKIEQFESKTAKGFIKSTYVKRDGRWIYDISFYSKDSRASKQIAIIYDEKYFDKADVLNIISSLNFLEEREAEADKYYKKGLGSLSSYDFIDAQFQFANAYYLSPRNSEYGLMLAKALFKNGKISFKSAKRILEYILKLNPDYKEARELLETINLELKN